jgi:hypothetical protein
MENGNGLGNKLVEEAIRQIRMRPFLSGLEITEETIEKWRAMITSATLQDQIPLTRLPFNTEDYELNKKGRIISLHLRGIITGEKVAEHYQSLVNMGKDERRYFGRFSSEYEFDRMISNEYVRGLLSKSPHSLLYRLNDHNPEISGSGHRKRRPLLVFEQATDEEIKNVAEIERRSTKKWGYSDY